MVGTDLGRGLGSPLRFLAELSLPHVINGAQAELIGARRDQAVDRHRRGLGLDAGQQDGPGSVWNREQAAFFHLPAARVPTSYPSSCQPL